MTVEWQKLVSETIKQCAPMMIVPPEIYKRFLAMHTPEYIAKVEAEHKKEQARLAAIEAAKTPAQRLKEKQDRCTHEFIHRKRLEGTPSPHNRWIKSKCKLCGKQVSRQFALGYMEGRERGYDDGYQERGQHETDEE